MREGRGAAEGELEGLFEKEATEDHEVVAVAVLGLHDHGGFEHGVAHEDVVGGPLGGVFGVCCSVIDDLYIGLMGRILTEVGHLLRPHGVNEVTLFRIGGCLEKTLGS